MELEGEGRPRRLAVAIRRVDLIPISSLAVSTQCLWRWGKFRAVCTGPAGKGLGRQGALVCQQNLTRDSLPVS